MTEASFASFANERDHIADSPSNDAAAQVEIVPHESWDREAGCFSDISYDQTAVFAAAKWGPEHVLACKVRLGGNIIGGAVATRFTVLGTQRGLYYVKFGPVWRRGGHPVAWSNCRSVVRALRHELCDNRGGLLTIVPRPHPGFATREAQLLLSLGFHAGRTSPDPNRYLVDLKSSVDPLAALSQKWRYNLKRARNEVLTVEEMDAADGYSAFVRLHRSMVERKRFPCDDAVDVIPRLAEALPAYLAPKVFLVLSGGRPIAGAVVGKVGDMACYLYGASSEEGLEHNAGYLLQWRIVERLRQSDQRWYDLGGEAMEPGLRQFKRGLVGRQGLVFETPGEFSCWTRPSAKLIDLAAYAARSARRIMRQHLVS